MFNTRSLVALLIGLGFIGVCAYLVYSDYTASSWPTKEGTITSSTYTKSTSSNTKSYTPKISYTYSIEGNGYTGKCCSVSSNDEVATQQLIKRYPVGTTTEILVDPTLPYQSRLKGEVKPFEISKLAFGGIGLLAVLVGLYRGAQQN